MNIMANTNHLKSALKYLGITQVELAKKLGLSYQGLQYHLRESEVDKYFVDKIIDIVPGVKDALSRYSADDVTSIVNQRLDISNDSNGRDEEIERYKETIDILRDHIKLLNEKLGRDATDKRRMVS